MKYCYASEFASVAITVPLVAAAVVEVVADVGTLVVASAVGAAVAADVVGSAVMATVMDADSVAYVGAHCGYFYYFVHLNVWRWLRSV